MLEAPERKQLRDAAAWSVVSAATGKQVDGGRSDQLRALNDDGASLAGVDLIDAHLQRLQLRGADLRDANFSRAEISGADFSCRSAYVFSRRCTNLSNANLFGAILYNAKFDGAFLSHTTFGAITTTVAGQRPDSARYLWHVSFRNAALLHTNMTGLLVNMCDFSGAIIAKTDFEDDRFNVGGTGNRFVKAIFRDVDLSRTDLTAKDLEEQGALLCRVKFSDGSTVSSHCKEVEGVDPFVVHTNAD